MEIDGVADIDAHVGGGEDEVRTGDRHVMGGRFLGLRRRDGCAEFLPRRIM